MERDRVGFEPQAVLHDWHEQVGQPTGSEMLHKLQEEGHEIWQEIDGKTPDQLNNLSPEEKKRLAKEVGDVIIAGLGWFDSQDLEFENTFWSTLSVMIDKYPPGLIHQIMAEDNLCREEAMAKAKTLYQSSFPST